MVRFTVNITALEDVLGEVKRRIDGVSEAVLVSRSGMHIAGGVPKEVHLETFVAMSAILLGAAETAAAELKEDCKEVTVRLMDSKMVVVSAGPKALLVLRTNASTDTMGQADEIHRLAKQVGDMV